MMDASKESILKNMLSAMVAIRRCAESAVKDKMPGVVDNIDGTIILLKRILKSDEPKTIGFFGAQKRGKSSIINYLLGAELMPTSPIPMSSVIVRVRHDSALEKGVYNIDITNQNGQMNTNQNLSEDSAREVIELYGSHRGDGVFEDVDTIEVASNFSGIEILESGGVLVDTPGAEMAFVDGSAEDPNVADSRRAIEELQRTHLVVFVERADYLQGESGHQFFTMQIKQLRPLSVVSFKDMYEVSGPGTVAVNESLKRQKLGSLMMRVYGINLERFSCVSCKEAESNKELSGMRVLKDRILTELRNLEFENGLPTCLSELEKNLKLVANDPDLGKDVARRIFAPATLPFTVMRKVLSDGGNSDSQSETSSRLAERLDRILNNYHS